MAENLPTHRTINSTESRATTARSTPRYISKGMRTSPELRTVATGEDLCAVLSKYEAESGLEEGSGVLISKTNHYYLVRCKNAWVPVRLQDLFDTDGQRVDKGTPFQTVKFAVVSLRSNAGGMKASIQSESDNTTRRKYSDMNLGLPTPIEPGESLLSLSRVLCEDVTAISLAESATNSDPVVLHKLIDTAKKHLMSKLPTITEELETVDSHKAEKANHSMKHCLRNLDASYTILVCDMCKNGKSAVVLSCGHRICLLCLPNKKKCSICHKPLNKVDSKLSSHLQKIYP